MLFATARWAIFAMLLLQQGGIFCEETSSLSSDSTTSVSASSESTNTETESPTVINNSSPTEPNSGDTGSTTTGTTVSTTEGPTTLPFTVTTVSTTEGPSTPLFTGTTVSTTEGPSTPPFTGTTPEPTTQLPNTGSTVEPNTPPSEATPPSTNTTTTTTTTTMIPPSTVSRPNVYENFNYTCIPNATCVYSLELPAVDQLLMSRANEEIKVGNTTLYDSTNTYASVNDRFTNYTYYVYNLSDFITNQVSNLTALVDKLEETIDLIESNLTMANESLNNVTNVFNSFPATDCYYYCISRRTTTPRPQITGSTSPGPTQYRPCDQLQCFNNGTCQQNENGAFCVCPGNFDSATNCTTVSCTSPGTSPVRPGPFNSPRTESKTCRWIATGNNITMMLNSVSPASFNFTGGDTLEISNSQQAGICTTFNSATDPARFLNRLEICVNGQTQVQFNLVSNSNATFFKLDVSMNG